MSQSTQCTSSLQLDYIAQLEDEYWNQMIIQALENYEYFKQMEEQLILSQQCSITTYLNKY